MDVVIQTIADCKKDTHDAVQLQVIKALLTAVTCPSTEVHGNSLLEAVRACYHIYLVSNNVVNRTTARASLSQMLDYVFRQMQAIDRASAEEAHAAEEAAAVEEEVTLQPARPASNG